MKITVAVCLPDGLKTIGAARRIEAISVCLGVAVAVVVSTDGDADWRAKGKQALIVEMLMPLRKNSTRIDTSGITRLVMDMKRNVIN